MPTGDPDAFARAHQQLRADPDIQFDLPRYQPPEIPGWVKWLAEFLEGISPLLKILFWVVLALVVIAILYALFRWLEGQPIRWPWQRDRAQAEAEAWRPDEAPARALLAEADALAAAGDYAGAAHLLLQRSIEDIDANRPQLVRPALTSRDLAAQQALPPGPRSAFARIVMAVEKSLFGRRPLAQQEWSDCRASYESFAFSPEWRR